MLFVGIKNSYLLQIGIPQFAYQQCCQKRERKTNRVAHDNTSAHSGNFTKEFDCFVVVGLLPVMYLRKKLTLNPFFITRGSCI